MTIRSWQLVLPATVIALLTSTWGMAVVVFLLARWASYVVFGGLGEGLDIRVIRNPVRGFGEEQAPRLDEGGPGVGT